jgi:hypothetical protein
MCLPVLTKPQANAIVSPVAIGFIGGHCRAATSLATIGGVRGQSATEVSLTSQTQPTLALPLPTTQTRDARELCGGVAVRRKGDIVDNAITLSKQKR